MWTVYLVRCSDESLYCGMTMDLDKQLREHNEGKNGTKVDYCWKRRPVKLVRAERFAEKWEAAKRYREIKRLPKRRKEELVGDK